jgi:hypothetical protein
MTYYYTLDVNDVGFYGGVIRPADIMKWALGKCKLNSNLRICVL